MLLYKINTILLAVFSFCAVFTSAQPASAKLTRTKQIKLVPQKVRVPEKFRVYIKEDFTVNIPEGYSANIFYSGPFSKCRFMCFGPDSVLYIANVNSGEVFALPDRDHNHVADTLIIAAKNAFGHDLKFYNGEMYVAEETKVEKFSDTDHDGIFETRSVFIDSILPGKKRPPGGHTTRTIVIDELAKKIYLSVGSSCNICREDDRAVIYEFDINGKNRRIFASGVRNAVGMTIDPYTGALWATNNGSDNQGNEIPPEWIDEIIDGGFYGYPFAYGNKVYFDFNVGEDYQKIKPITKSDSALVKKMKKPAALVTAHSAPMAIKFANASFKQYDKGAFVAYRGSFNRQPPTGYKVVYVHFDKNNQVKFVSDFITGFIQSPSTKAWARPVGLEADLRGNLYMGSDDINQFILVLSPKK